MLQFKKLSFVILSIFVYFTCFVTFSYSNSEEPTTYSAACLLMDSETGKILYEKNAFEKRFPASTTKIMTAILTLEHTNLNDVATVSHNAIFSVPPTYANANLKEGEELTIEQLLHVLLIPSANDAANVLAEHIGGSIENFATMMNEKAVEIGCQNTHFVNPNGVHNNDHYSTAYDLALMGKYAMKNANLRSIVCKTRYTLPITNRYDKEDRIFNTTNELLKENNSTRADNYYYSACNGVKTGYTDNAKNCIIASAKKQDSEFIVVILGGEKTPDGLSARSLDCINLFDYAFSNYEKTTLIQSNDLVKKVSISSAPKDSNELDILVKDDICVLLNKNEPTENLSPIIELHSDFKAPIAKGDIVGKITYTIDGNSYSSDLIAGNNIEKAEFIKLIFQVLLALLILTLIFKFLELKNNSRKRKKGKRMKGKYLNK